CWQSLTEPRQRCGVASPRLICSPRPATPHGAGERAWSLCAWPPAGADSLQGRAAGKESSYATALAGAGDSAPDWGPAHVGVSFVWLCALGHPHDPPDYSTRLYPDGPPQAVMPGGGARGFAVPAPLWEGAASCLAAPPPVDRHG